MMNEALRRDEAHQLDERILALIATWRKGHDLAEVVIDQLFIAVAQHQLRFNAPLQTYANSRAIHGDELHTWHDIPCVPSSAFKDATLASFPYKNAQACFQTSGTTAQRRGSHYMETTKVYDEAAKAIFERLVLTPAGWNQKPFRIINLAPDAQDRPDSSLGHMVATFADEWSDKKPLNFVQGETINVQAFCEAVAAARSENVRLCIIGTAIAYALLLQALNTINVPLPPEAIVIETGGFKGRELHLDRATLYAELERCFVIPSHAIFAEFGMTELASQYYDSAASRAHAVRTKIGPPWLRSRIVDANGNDVAQDTLGLLRHYDLANRSSVVAIETEDLAVAQDEGFVLIGREVGAELRGCSLDAEGLQALVERVNTTPS